MTHKKFKLKIKEYLSQFKKEYTQRTLAEKLLISALFTIEFEYGNKSNGICQRHFGIIEATLLYEGKLVPGAKFEYKKNNTKFLWMNFTEKETYYELLLRMAKEYLRESNCL